MAADHAGNKEPLLLCLGYREAADDGSKLLLQHVLVEPPLSTSWVGRGLAGRGGVVHATTTMGERAADRTPDSGQDPARAALTAREAASRLGVNERTIRRAIGRGELPATKHAGVYQVTSQDLACYRARRPVLARPSPRLLRLVPSSTLQRDRARTIPAALTPLIGRESEIASAVELLRQPEVRLLTLTGAGGVGKSRLALAVAAELSEAFAEGVAFVPLAPVRDSNLVSTAVAQALGVRELHDRPLDEALRSHLRRREMLLILDNFEHRPPGRTPYRPVAHRVPWDQGTRHEP